MLMKEEALRVLLVEDNAGDARLLRGMFNEQGAHHTQLTHVGCMGEAEKLLAARVFDLILLDLGLPDAQGLGAVRRAHAAAPHVCLVVLTGLDDESLGKQVMYEGAQGHLTKGQITPRGLRRALRYAVERKNAEKYLAQMESRYRELLEAAPDAMVISDSNGLILLVNAEAERLFGYSRGELVGQVVEVLVPERFRKEHPGQRHEYIAHPRARKMREGRTLYALRKDGTEFPAEIMLSPLESDKGSLVTAAIRDITLRITMEKVLFEEKERAQVTLNSIGDAVVCTDISGNITFLNLVAEKMTGWSWQEAAGRPMVEVFRILDATTRETTPNPMEKAFVQDRTMHMPLNCVLIRRDGCEIPIEDSVAPIHDREGQATGAVVVFRDVSAARAMALQMTHSAQHDFLTGLPNRMLVNDRIGQAIALAQRHLKKVAVMFLDLDGFKHINDSLGHPIGDKLLQSIAKRLVDCVRCSDTVSRQGGDEFVVLLSEVEQSEDAAVKAARLLRAVGGALFH